MPVITASFPLFFCHVEDLTGGVCQRDYTKTTEPDFMKLDKEVKHEQKKNPLSFGVDLDCFLSRLCLSIVTLVPSISHDVNSQ